MKVLSFALIADGSSDRSLIPIVTWAIRAVAPETVMSPPRFLARGGRSVEEAISGVIAGYQPDLVFVHRDAERLPLQDRRREIPTQDGVVPVIPVRMSEAWLLIEERAIHMAAGNPNGKVALDIPPTSQLESLPDPKSVLRRLLVQASGLTGRRSKRFDRAAAAQRVADLIEDFEPLRTLGAFQAFEDELRGAVGTLDRVAWGGGAP